MSDHQIVPSNSASSNQSPFDRIRRVDNDGEHWSARELMTTLGYAKWSNFSNVIDKAKTACDVSGYDVADHFTEVGNMVDIGSGSQRELSDFRLSRYACYLVAMNGDSAKLVIAEAQTYFAAQTRRQEIADQAAPPSGLDVLESMIREMRLADNRVKALEAQIPEIHEKLGENALAIEKLTDKVDDKDYQFVAAFCKVQGIPCTVSMAQQWGRDAKVMSVIMRKEVIPTPVVGKAWPTENRFHKEVLLKVCVPKPDVPKRQLELPTGD